ncbi:MAG: hypothetical protein KIT69_13785 [Propionibacteriaceae bacterium]|nr:hypothetical protein [Propionibacteriaceae bacterium]
MSDSKRLAPCPSGAGFSLVEVVIAMLLLALMALGVLPLILGTIQTSTANRSLVAATTFGNAQLSGLRAQFGNDRIDTTCSGLLQTVKDINDGALAKDPSGSGLASELGGPRTNKEGELPAPSCTAGVAGPIAVVVAVEVFPEGSRSRVITSLSTEILVGAP